MKMALGSDHGGFDIKEILKASLDERGIGVKDFGCHSRDAVDYPDFAFDVAQSVASQEVDQGILVCKTGIGMVIAGGCASGTLMRVGEGFAMQMLALVFFVIGSLWGAKDMGWWNLNVIADAPRVFLPDIFGWLGALVLQLLVIACLYVAADLWERKKMGTADEE